MQGIKVVGEVARDEPYTVQTINTISQLQYLVACCFSSYISNVFGTYHTVFFSSYLQVKSYYVSHQR
jgi:hypothetical protein